MKKVGQILTPNPESLLGFLPSLSWSSRNYPLGTQISKKLLKRHARGSSRVTWNKLRSGQEVPKETKVGEWDISHVLGQWKERAVYCTGCTDSVGVGCLQCFMRLALFGFRLASLVFGISCGWLQFLVFLAAPASVGFGWSSRFIVHCWWISSLLEAVEKQIGSNRTKSNHADSKSNWFQNQIVYYYHYAIAQAESHPIQIESQKCQWNRITNQITNQSPNPISKRLNPKVNPRPNRITNRIESQPKRIATESDLNQIKSHAPTESNPIRMQIAAEPNRIIAIESAETKSRSYLSCCGELWSAEPLEINKRLPLSMLWQLVVAPLVAASAR